MCLFLHITIDQVIVVTVVYSVHIFQKLLGGNEASHIYRPPVKTAAVIVLIILWIRISYCIKNPLEAVLKS